MDLAKKSRPAHSQAHGTGLFTRMREATGTVYGDIGTSVLYTVMEITRETVRLKHHVEGERAVHGPARAGGRPDHAPGRPSAGSASSSGP